MKETDLQRHYKLKQDTTEHSMNDAYIRVSKMGKRFTDITINTKFTAKKRIKMLNQMIEYFQELEEYEKCFVLYEILKCFNDVE